MAKSKYEYVKHFEQDDRLLPGCWLVVRLDGRGFHRFSSLHGFTKPNDLRALQLANRCAETVMKDVQDAILAYGESDEYSFVLDRKTRLFGRRESKITTTVCSLFSAAYVLYWPEFFPETPLQYPPSFDARAVCYPTSRILRDYLSWRQADCHINNLYNTCFWTLVQQGGMPEKEAEETLRGTFSADKNELLFSRFGINYAHLPAIFRKGTTLVWEEVEIPVTTPSGESALRRKKAVRALDVDIIGDQFWHDRPWLLGEDTPLPPAGTEDAKSDTPL
ncbi:Thg1 C terminal domain-containing protein [Thamnocephalis sphaerospora]|uniref:tRNA(His) guanylyltransferase n=1 Tax=Thamnocephalis sphaerospora TaxID=78915 RepID=A0A4P9XK00_9FUNG|nr:Thg1 C terminal domain-containing protein [Thamnocephalis sphaerospora]|eukprot:RKP06114.1 Thg1 C terminal domain-containing protein [Thamnocephalis sphaerospora]